MFGKSDDRTFLDADVEAWVFETWAWLMREFGGMAMIRWTKLALPTTDFFPRTTTEGHERALYLFEIVKRLMSMGDWPCELEECAPPPATTAVDGPHGDAVELGIRGRYHPSAKGAAIGYDPDLIHNAEALIAVMAHELAQYRLSKAQSEAPGGPIVKKLTAELAVAFSGMAVFNANVAYEYHASVGGKYGGSWGSTTTGYFAESSWALAIAIFCALKGVEPPLDQLKHSVADLTKDAAHYLKHNPEKVDALRTVR